MTYKILVFLFIAVFIIMLFTQPQGENKPVMYGSSICPHCQDQKEILSPGEYTYIECNTPQGQAKACKDEQIQLYPTWIFNSGCRVEGVINQTRFNDLKKGGACP